MDQMVAQLRGSRTLQTGFRELPAVLPEPASTEIFEIADRAQRGLGLENALIAAGKKFESRNFMLLLAVFRIFARQGGNVIDPLQRMSMAYKDLIKLDEALKTASTQARTMFYIINSAIFFIFSFVSIARPQMIYDIFSNIVGIIIFSVGVIVYIAGAIWMWSMMKVDV
jgi:Flp pilus assembly protein TadB